MEFKRGDTYAFKFQRVSNAGTVITDLPDKMWFTVKGNADTKTKAIQKTLGNGITYTSADNFYHVVIENEDTRDLPYDTYVYDIQIKIGTVISTIASGTIELGEEVTFDYE